jgi:AraC family transcriptional regulator of adaptative response / DNA-3-methyladenine glycosylase II
MIAGHDPTLRPGPCAPGQESPAGFLAGIRLEPGRYRDPAALAAAAGLELAALEKWLLEHAHQGAAGFLESARVQAACRLLLERPGPAWAAGEACGFRDPDEFRARLLAATGLAPEGYQALDGPEPAWRVALPPDYRVEDVLGYHGRDPLSLSERVEGRTLAKALALPGGPGVLELAFGDGEASCRWHPAAGGGVPEPGFLAGLHRRVVRMLGLGGDPAPFERFAAAGALGGLVALRPGLRIPLTADVWESLVWAVLGQQVNLAFAYTLRRKLIGLCGTAAGGGLTAHPAPPAVAALEPEDLRPLQFSRSKAEYLIALARKVAGGGLALEELPDGSALLAAGALAAERGIGPWTTHYVLMRGCGFGDCVPLGDAGLTLALQRQFSLERRPSVRETAALMAPFAPHRSLATFHLWASLKGVPA